MEGSSLLIHPSYKNDDTYALREKNVKIARNIRRFHTHLDRAQKTSNVSHHCLLLFSFLTQSHAFAQFLEDVHGRGVFCVRVATFWINLSLCAWLSFILWKKRYFKCLEPAFGARHLQKSLAKMPPGPPLGRATKMTTLPHFAKKVWELQGTFENPILGFSNVSHRCLLSFSFFDTVPRFS